MMRVVTVDDQGVELFHMQILLKHCTGVELVGESTSIAEAAQLINETRPDAVFLDVDFGHGETGFDLLPLLECDCHIVFVTLHNDYAVRAFQVNALDYILKPVSLERLQESLNRIQNQLPREETVYEPYHSNDMVYLKNRDQRMVVPLERIAAVKADRDYTTVYTLDNGIFYMRRTLKEWKDRLPPELFSVLDRKLMVAHRQIREIRNDKESGGKVVVGNSQFSVGPTALKTAGKIMDDLQR